MQSPDEKWKLAAYSGKTAGHTRRARAALTVIFPITLSFLTSEHKAYINSPRIYEIAPSLAQNVLQMSRVPSRAFIS